MAFLVEDRVVFNRQRRTGSKWTKNALLEAGLKCELIKGDSNHSCSRGPVTFCFLRNPFTWYPSYHSHISILIKLGSGKRDPLLNFLDDDLNTFVKKIYEGKIHVGKKFGFMTETYLEFINPDPGEICYVGRQEYLADHLVLILKLIGFNINETKLRKTIKHHVSPSHQELSRESKERIRVMEAEIFEQFYSTTSFSSNQIHIFRGS